MQIFNWRLLDCTMLLRLNVFYLLPGSSGHFTELYSFRSRFHPGYVRPKNCSSWQIRRHSIRSACNFLKLHKQKWHEALAWVWSFIWLGWDLRMENDLLLFVAVFDIDREWMTWINQKRNVLSSRSWTGLEQTCLHSLFFSSCLQIMLQLHGYSPKHSCKFFK